MSKVSTIGLDLAKHVFQVHGADASGGVVFRKPLRRGQLFGFLAAGHGVWLRWKLAPAPISGLARLAIGARRASDTAGYVKPFVKCQKNDMADAEAICEAAQRPTMRFVAVQAADAGEGRV